jgi:hypothetical protein
VAVSPFLIRILLATPWGKDWPIVKRELARCAELRQAMMQGSTDHLTRLDERHVPA